MGDDPPAAAAFASVPPSIDKEERLDEGRIIMGRPVLERNSLLAPALLLPDRSIGFWEYADAPPNMVGPL